MDSQNGSEFELVVRDSPTIKKKKEVKIIIDDDNNISATPLSKSNSAEKPPAPVQKVFKIYLMDGSYKAIRIDPISMTIEELWEVVALDKLMLTQRSAPCFFLWGVKGDLELLLYTHQKVAAVFKDWSIYEERYYPGGSPSASSSPSVPRTLSMKNINRTLSVKSMKARLSVLNLGEEKVQTYADKDELRLLFRTTSVLPMEEEMKHTDPGAVHLFYVQAVHNVIHANYPCTPDLAIKLGGIQLQLTVGNCNPSVHKTGYLRDIIAQYVPEHLHSKMKVEDWERELLQEHAKLSNANPVELKLSYLSIVRQWPHYGCTFFKAKYIQNESIFQQEFEGNVRVGVNQNGLHLIDPKAMKIMNIPFAMIVEWNSKKEQLYVVVKGEKNKGLFGKSRGNDRFIYFRSPQSELINDALCDWQEELEANPSLATSPSSEDKGSSSSSSKKKKGKKSAR